MFPMKPVKVHIGKAVYVPAAEIGRDESASVQVFPAQVSSLFSEGRKHFVICAYSPLLNQEECESVASHLRLGDACAVCDFIIYDTEGGSTVVADVDDKASACEAAAAVAVVKASCGWDENNPIMVRVNEIEVLVVSQFEGNEWIASFPNAG
jgi:hypothetical protein